MGAFIVSDGLPQEATPRRWRGHWLCFLGRCGCVDWQGCCLAKCLPCVAFGWNANKVLRASFWLEILKYIAILGVARFIYAGVSFAHGLTCAAAGDRAVTEDAKLRVAQDCDTAFAPLILIVMVASTACLLYWAVFVGGPRRRQIKQALGISASDANGACCCHNDSESCNDDCCLHYWCTFCALAQETRTVLHYEHEAAQQRMQGKDGYMPLINAPASVNGMARPAKEGLELPV